MRRSIWMWFLLALGLSACGSTGNTDWNLLWKMVDVYRNGPPGVTLDEAAAVPYASIGVRVGDGPQQMFVLASNSGENNLWLEGQHAAVVTRDGRIVRSSGLGHDLSGYVVREPSTHLDRTRTTTLTWSADFADMSVFSAPITCEDKPVGPDQITILGKTINTIRVDEACNSPALDWKFTNIYWLDPQTATVWRSLQHVHPKLDVVELSVLRPAS